MQAFFIIHCAANIASEDKIGLREVPLSGAAVSVLSPPPSAGGPLGDRQRQPGRPSARSPAPRRCIHPRAGLDDLRIRDLRHAFASRVSPWAKACRRSPGTSATTRSRRSQATPTLPETRSTPPPTASPSSSPKSSALPDYMQSKATTETQSRRPFRLPARSNACRVGCPPIPLTGATRQGTSAFKTHHDPVPTRRSSRFGSINVLSLSPPSDAGLLMEKQA